MAGNGAGADTTDTNFRKLTVVLASHTTIMTKSDHRRGLKNKASRLSGPGLEIIVRHARQLFDECNDGPDFLVGYVNGAKARHSCHVDAVLDDPKQLLRRGLVGQFLEVGRVWTQSFGELAQSTPGPP